MSKNIKSKICDVINNRVINIKVDYLNNYN